jgi:hypothetical protein
MRIDHWSVCGRGLTISHPVDLYDECATLRVRRSASGELQPLLFLPEVQPAKRNDWNQRNSRASNRAYLALGLNLVHGL